MEAAPAPSISTARSQALGWMIGIALALLINAGVPLLLSHLSHHRPVTAAPLPTRRLAIQSAPPAPPKQSTAVVAAMPPHVEPMALPPLDLPSIPRDDAAIAVSAIPGVVDFSNLPMAMPEIVVAGMSGYDEPPRRLTDLDLERFYPRAARLRGTAGETVIRLSIADDGSVSAVEVLRSSPIGVFDLAAQNLGRAQRFLPARQGSQNVASLVTMTVVWTLER